MPSSFLPPLRLSLNSFTFRPCSHAELSETIRPWKAGAWLRSLISDEIWTVWVAIAGTVAASATSAAAAIVSINARLMKLSSL
jgi:hypothetical protein